jgi:hypothetical protein
MKPFWVISEVSTCLADKKLASCPTYFTKFVHQFRTCLAGSAGAAALRVEEGTVRERIFLHLLCKEELKKEKDVPFTNKKSSINGHTHRQTRKISIS